MKKFIVVILLISIIIGVIVVVSDKEKETVETKTSYKVTFDEMYEIITDNGVIIDVRTKEEFDEGHIDGSVNIPLDEIDESFKELYNKDTQIFVYCRSGVRSSDAKSILDSLGFTNVYDAGGILDYTGKLVK